MQRRIKYIMDEEERTKDRWKLSSTDVYLAQILHMLYYLRVQIDGMFQRSKMPDMSLKEFITDYESKFREYEIGSQTPKPVEKSIEDMTPEEIQEKKDRISRWSRARWGIGVGMNLEALERESS